DDQVQVTHHLAEERWRDLSEREPLSLAAAGESDALDGQSLRLCRRQEAIVELQPRRQILIMERALDGALLGAGNPSAPPQQRQRLPRVHLVAGVAQRSVPFALLSGGQNVELTEHLLERLHSLAPQAVAL